MILLRKNMHSTPVLPVYAIALARIATWAFLRSLQAIVSTRSSTCSPLAPANAHYVHLRLLFHLVLVGH